MVDCDYPLEISFIWKVSFQRAEVVLVAPGTPDANVIRGMTMAAMMTGNATAHTGEYVGFRWVHSCMHAYIIPKRRSSSQDHREACRSRSRSSSRSSPPPRKPSSQNA